ncbi:MAG: OpgC domain-containing protein, partial [Hyphomicrobiaceae bacterium]
MAHGSSTSAIAIAPTQRDARVDFFRGLALLFIFIDHVKENTLQYVTMQNFGFADAAEVFVALAGYASFLAYTRVFDRQGWWAGLVKVASRVSKLYLAHMLFLIACVAILITATLVFDNPIYESVLNLEPFFEEPARASRKALLLVHQPAMLDILPLYIVLLIWFPVLLLLMRIHLLVALAASVTLWLGANLRGWNLPAYPENEGWFFNPFAWQL